MASAGEIPGPVDRGDGNAYVFNGTQWLPEGRAKGHVFSICGNCGGAWPSDAKPESCRDCGKGPVSSTAPCPGCDDCSCRRPE